jgi:hypothetical protein
VEDLDRQVLTHLTEDVLVLLLDDLAGPMMGVDHVVADFEVDALDLANELENLDVIGGVGDGVLLCSTGGPECGPRNVYVCR